MTVKKPKDQNALKVLFVNRPDTFSVPGGDTNHMLSLVNGLNKLGIQADVDCRLYPDPRGYDIIYIINILIPSITIRQVAAIRAHTHAPIVLMPLYWDRSEALWGEAVVQHVFETAKTSQERQKLLQKVAKGTLAYKNYTKNGHNYPDVDYELTQQEIFKYVDHIIPISQLEMDGMQRNFDLDGMPYSVINAGADLADVTISPKLFTDKYQISDFILTSGRVEPRKNQLLLLEALRDTNLPIVVAGGQPEKKYLQLCQEIAPANTLFVGRISDDMLASARAAARVHALPSWWECAGLSSMEGAMADCNVVMGKHGAEPEYFGKGVYYCDPSSVQSIRQSVLDAYNNYHIDDKKRQAIRKRLLENYNWPKIALDTQNVLQSVYENFLKKRGDSWKMRRAKREIAQAYELYYKGDKATALNQLEPYVNNQSNNISALNLVGVIFTDFGVYDKAVQILRVAQKLDPDNIPGQRYLAKALVADNRYNAAEEVLNKVLKTYQYDDISLKLLEWLKRKKSYTNPQQRSPKKTESSPGSQSRERSVIIVSYNNEETIKSCLSSVIKHLNERDELIVVDNTSTDATLSVVSDHFKGLTNCRLIENSANLGFSEASNIGIRNSHGKYKVLLNPDTIVSHAWLDRLEHHLKKSPEIAAVGPISNYAAGNQNMDKYLQGELSDKSDADQIAADFYTWNKGQSVETKLLTGFCMMIRSEVLKTLGLLDPKLFLGNDDLDLSWRWRLNGYRLIVASDVFIYHIGQHSFKQSGKSTTQRLVQESSDYLYHKLADYYGETNIPTPQEIWGVNWFKPTVNLFNPKAKLRTTKNKSQADVQKDTKPVSIVMLTWNALDFTRKTVESIREHTHYPHEIIFVDNASSDGTTDYLQEIVNKNPNYRLITNLENRGFAAGNNQGAEVAEGPYLLFLNNDILVSDNWLSHMVKALESDDQIGIVGPMTNSISGRQMFQQIPYSDDAGYYRFAAEVEKIKKDVISPRRRIAGFAMLMKQSLFREAGGFDESFGTGNFEDDDLCLRVRDLGYAMMVAEAAFIHHFGSQTFKANKINYNQNIDERMQLFREKWPDVKYEELLEIHHSLADDHRDELNTAETYIENENVDQAEPIYRKVYRENPLSTEAMYGLSLVDYAKGNYKHSLHRLKKLLQRNPAYEKAYNLLGLISYSSSKYDQAETFFSKTIELDPDNLDAHQNLAETLLSRKKYTEAEQKLRQNIERFPDHIQSSFRLAQLYAGKGLTEKAIALLEKAHESDPRNKEITEFIKMLQDREVEVA